MKKFFITVTVLALMCLWAVSQQNSSTIIIYSSMEQFRGEALQEQLNEEFPDLHVKVVYASTGKSAAKLSVEGEKTDADIIVGLETGYMTRVIDIMAPMSHLSAINYIDEFNPSIFDNQAVIWERYGGSLIINTDVLKKYDLPLPKTYQDLLNPIYKDKIAMPDPKSSGTGYFFYKSLVNEFGVEGALAYFDALHPNIKQFTESGSGPIKLLNQGEIAIAMGMTFQAVNEINKGMPFELVFPELGSPYNTSATSMLKGRENDPDVVRVYTYIINEAFIFDKDLYSPEQVYKDQVNKIEKYPEHIPYANMEGIHSIDEKDRLLEQWKY